MKRVNRCARPTCGRKFGLVRHFIRGGAYCSKECQKKHNAEKTAEDTQKRRWLQWLNS